MKIVGVAVLLVYAIPSAWLADGKTRQYYTSSQRVRHLVQRIAYAHKLHPDKIFFIKGVDSSLFWTAFHDRPFRIFGRTAIYITPEVEHQILRTNEQQVWQHFLPEYLILELIRAGKAMVYEAVDDRVRNVTKLYRAMLEAKPQLEHARWIDVGSPIFEASLGEGWYAPERAFRWSMKRATFRLRGPAGPRGYLRISGATPPEAALKTPMSIKVTVDGNTIASTRLDSESSRFALAYPLPPDVEGRNEMDVAIEVDHTVTVPPDTRALGLAFSRFEVTP
jgi:hypothetical protein